jgi:hypothetical protein
LLDEIGELPHEAQLRMLHVLQDKEINRVGGSKPIKVNIRLIAATHRNLEDLVQKEKFRRDLYFRIRVFPIMIPPLKHRKGDIPNLTQHFIDKKSREMGITGPFSLAPGALDDLINYDWPGMADHGSTRGRRDCESSLHDGREGRREKRRCADPGRKAEHLAQPHEENGNTLWPPVYKGNLANLRMQTSAGSTKQN